jgi:DNA-binding CsgD family transcriptional regulator
MWWSESDLHTVDRAIAAARRGMPSVLSIVGEPGIGKSALLEELVRRADGFSVFEATGDRTATRSPYASLTDWVALDGRPYQAAQRLRELVETRQHTGPVLLALDDLQWMDPESVEAIVWLVRRAAGDRLLVAAAMRPLTAGAHPEWRRLLLDDGTTELALAGLDVARTTELLRSVDASAPAALAARLHEHTGGNPLYLRSLLREHSIAELSAMESLPAPADLAASLAARLQTLSPPAAAAVRALAVLGSGWEPLPLVARVAGVADPASALRASEADAPVEFRGTGVDAEVRITHAVTAAALYAGLDPDERRAMHLRAAGLVRSPEESLRHRFAAADRYDDALAEEAAAFAWQLHLERFYRQAGRLLRRASTVTSDPALRERRWLDSLFETTLARDIDEVIAELGTVMWARDPVRRALVQGFVLVVQKRWLEAAAILDDIREEPLALADDYVRFRVRTLRGWAGLVTGQPPERVLPGLELARAEASSDPVFTGYLTFAYGMSRSAGAQENPLGPGGPSRYQGAWSGAADALSGLPDRAVSELEPFCRLIDDGLIDMGDGVFHALLGLALFTRGDWTRAHIAIGVAADAPFGGVNPMVRAVEPLGALATGAVDELPALMAAARAGLRAAPWPQAMVAATIADTFALRLAGTDPQRREYHGGVRRDFGSADLPGRVAPLWGLHAGFAAAWAGDTDAVHALADRLAPVDVPWAAAGATWLRGLAAASAPLLAEAVDGWPGGMPVHEAILLSDLAALGGDGADRAARLVASLGGRYLSVDAGPDVLAQLSDRERDVVALLADGLSYAQIAKELYVTRSTVAFHLSNAYAKTGTTSRHELVQLLRATTGRNDQSA